MPEEKKSKLSSRARSRSTGRQKTRPPGSQILGEAELETRVLEILKTYSGKDGLTCGELAKKCRVDWRRGLAAQQRTRNTEATAQDVQGFVYDLWKRGLVFAEPPVKGKKSVRIWSMDGARIKFPLACPASRMPAMMDHLMTQQSLKSAYEKFVPQHLGGFVPIFKVRRELA